MNTIDELSDKALNHSYEFEVSESSVYLDFTYSNSKFSPGNYLEFLKWVKKNLNEDILSDLLSCGSHWLKYWCPGDENKGHYVFKPRMCRNRKYCPKCAESYTYLRAKRVYEVMEQIDKQTSFSLYVMHIVFTLPRELWNCDLRKFIKAVEKTIKYPIKGSKAVSGGVIGVHTWHSKNPFSGRYPHVHVVLLNCVLEKIAGNSLWYFKRTRPYFNVNLLKVRYLRFLKKYLGYSGEKINLKVYYTRIKNKELVMHWLKYAFRRPIYDFYKYIIENDRKYSKKELDFFREVINERINRIRWIGFLAPGSGFYLNDCGIRKRVSYLSLIGVLILRLKDWVRMRLGYCPIHHKKLEYIGFALPHEVDRPPPVPVLENTT